MSKATKSTLPDFAVGDVVWIRQPVYDKHWSDGGKERNTVIRTVRIIEVHCHMKARDRSKVDFIGYLCEMYESVQLIPTDHESEVTWFHEDSVFRSLDEALHTNEHREGSSKIYNYKLLEMMKK